MQASKIMPQTTYAIMHDGKLARFQVAAVTTSRVQATGSPHDYKSTVTGRLIVDGVPHTGPEITIEPTKVLGPFEQYAELAEQKRREDEESARQSNERVEAVQALWRTLYSRCGKPCPNSPTEYRQPFRVGHSGALEINADGVKMLSEALDRS